MVEAEALEELRNRYDIYDWQIHRAVWLKVPGSI